MQDLIVQIYDRHFAIEDLQASLAFYKSEPGQRMLKELPNAMNEAMTTGQIWGQQKAAELEKELLDEQAQKQAAEKKKPNNSFKPNTLRGGNLQRYFSFLLPPQSVSAY